MDRTRLQADDPLGLIKKNKSTLSKKADTQGYMNQTLCISLCAIILRRSVRIRY